ncbi:MAG: hypothetical protein H6Q73_3628 [Firmicutes bacterium]|nr:hypothetical protein [Bacillota bacterium]
MMNDEVRTKLSVCGLDCTRCVDYENGEIKSLSARLADLLSGYERVAKLKSVNNPFFKEYPLFLEFLHHFTQGSCGGCRSDNLRCPIECNAKTCHRQHRVDFCFECKEYPCDTQFEGKTRERWLERNNRMKEIGVKNYYLEQSKLSRY